MRLDVDFAGLGAAWKAGALRARRAADWVAGRVFVSVVVALGTEPVLAVRSDGPPACGRSDGESWVVVKVGRVVRGEVVGPADVLVPQSVEKTPSATDCLVVVAGVTVGGSGSAPESGDAVVG